MFIYVHGTITGLVLNVGDGEPLMHISQRHQQEFMGELKIPTCHMHI